MTKELVERYSKYAADESARRFNGHQDWIPVDIADWEIFAAALKAAERQIGHKAEELEGALGLGNQLADWINLVGPALQELLDAYERRIRSLCTPEELEKRPWECREWIEARKALESKPMAVVEISIKDTGTQAKSSARSDGKDYWLIYFEDADRRPEIFNDGEAARRRYEQISTSWNARLFACIGSNVKS